MKTQEEIKSIVTTALNERALRIMLLAILEGKSIADALEIAETYLE